MSNLAVHAAAARGVRYVWKIALELLPSKMESIQNDRANQIRGTDPSLNKAIDRLRNDPSRGQWVDVRSGRVTDCRATLWPRRIPHSCDFVDVDQQQPPLSHTRGRNGNSQNQKQRLWMRASEKDAENSRFHGKQPRAAMQENARVRALHIRESR